ncbi:MAG: ABC transporter substrate-binding protein [Actinomycetales bacterium]|nr:MAG: ABC transporter substrate-binding protein [Actinomycetales bacterium]
MQRSMRLISFGLAVGVAVSLAACSESTGESTDGSGDSSAAAGEGPIKIGVVLDITGPGASLGGPERDTVQMLADKLKEDGGINGREVEVIIEDNGSTEDGAAKATNKLLNTDKVDILLGASRTGPSLAMRPIVEPAEKPMISFAANVAIIDDAKWVFKTAQNDRVVLEKMADDMKAKGYAKIAVARDSSGFGEGVPEMLAEIGQDQGLEVVKVEKFAPNQTDFTPQMISLRDANPDAVLIWGIPPAASAAQVSYNNLIEDVPVYHSHGIGNKVFLDNAGDSANGVLAPLGRMLVADQLADDDPQKPVVTQFIADYTDKYGKAPSTFAGHAYDGFTLAVNALEKVGTDPEKLRAELEATKDWPGISGVFTMSPDDHSGLTKDALVMVTVEDGKWKVAG